MAVAISRSKPRRTVTLPDPRLRLLSAYYLARRGLTGSRHPDVRRMRQLREAFYWRIWRHAAEAAGAALTPLSESVAEIARGGRRLRVCGSMVSLDDPISLQLAGDKPAVYGLLAKSAIPVPPHVTIDAAEFEREAGAILRSLPLPLVVKPAANTGGGAGVSTNVRTRAQLRRGVAWANAFGPRILIESMVEGDCYRVLVMDGEVRDSVLRGPPHVVGDGRSTVAQLITEENRLRLNLGMDRAQGLIVRDPDLASTLAAQGLTVRSRPAEGRAVRLKCVINDNRAAENQEANGRLCDAVLEAARRAARTIGLRLAGVDLICRDPSVPLEQSGGAIIDVNTTPSFYYHYCRFGTAFAVAEHLLQSVLAEDSRHAD